MDNLSGGEKTVAALALLFAIHRLVNHLDNDSDSDDGDEVDRIYCCL